MLNSLRNFIYILLKFQRIDILTQNYVATKYSATGIDGMWHEWNVFCGVEVKTLRYCC